MKLRITVLPGDGVGPEVTAEAVRVLRTVADLYGHDFKSQTALMGGVAILAHGTPLPDTTLRACLSSDAVLLGAVGAPEFDKLPVGSRPESGLLTLRQELGGFANLRPASCHKALVSCSPLRGDVVDGTDVMIVRELLGGLYFGQPRGGDDNQAFNTMRYSVEEVTRVARIAFDVARRRRKRVVSVDKANVLETSRLWRRVVDEVGVDYPDVCLEHMYVDACAMRLVTKPAGFDVILTENLFGDILSDEASVVTGSIGMLPSATVGGKVDLYEPVHGSAPDIAGHNVANPIGAIASAAMLLRHTARLEEEACAIESAIAAVLMEGYRTADIARPGEKVVTTSEMGAHIDAAMRHVPVTATA